MLGWKQDTKKEAEDNAKFDWKQNSKEIAESTYAELLGFNELATATAEDNAKQKGNMS